MNLNHKIIIPFNIANGNALSWIKELQVPFPVTQIDVDFVLRTNFKAARENDVISVCVLHSNLTNTWREHTSTCFGIGTAPQDRVLLPEPTVIRGSYNFELKDHNDVLLASDGDSSGSVILTFWRDSVV